jgi:nitrogen regulatory protein P-II 1
LLIAYIRPEKLSTVKKALYARGIYAMSVTNALGSGQQKGFTETYRGIVTEVNLLKKVRIEVGVPADKAEDALAALQTGAHTGREGDGIIFVQDVARTVRVRTGEAP